MPAYSMRVNAPLVTLDVGALAKDGSFISGLKKEYFRVLEDGVSQPITSGQSFTFLCGNRSFVITLKIV